MPKKEHKIIIKNNIKINNVGTSRKKKRTNKRTKTTKSTQQQPYKNAPYNPQGISYYTGGGSIPLSSAHSNSLLRLGQQSPTGISQPTTTSTNTQLVTRPAITNKAEYNTTSLINPKPPTATQLAITNGDDDDNTTNKTKTTTRIKRIKTGTKLDQIKKDGLYEQYKAMGIKVTKRDTVNDLNRKYHEFMTKNKQPKVEEPVSDADDETTTKYVQFKSQEPQSTDSLHKLKSDTLTSTGFTPKTVKSPLKMPKDIPLIDQSPIYQKDDVQVIDKTKRPQPLGLVESTTLNQPVTLFPIEEPDNINITNHQEMETVDETQANGFVSVASADDGPLLTEDNSNNRFTSESEAEYFKQTPDKHDKHYDLRSSSIQSVGKFADISPDVNTDIISPEEPVKKTRGRKKGSVNKKLPPSQFTQKMALGVIEPTKPVGRPKKSDNAPTTSALTETKHAELRHHKVGAGVSQFTSQIPDNDPDALFNAKDDY